MRRALVGQRLSLYWLVGIECLAVPGNLLAWCLGPLNATTQSERLAAPVVEVGLYLAQLGGPPRKSRGDTAMAAGGISTVGETADTRRDSEMPLRTASLLLTPSAWPAPV